MFGFVRFFLATPQGKCIDFLVFFLPPARILAKNWAKIWAKIWAKTWATKSGQKNLGKNRCKHLNKDLATNLGKNLGKCLGKHLGKCLFKKKMKDKRAKILNPELVSMSDEGGRRKRPRRKIRNRHENFRNSEGGKYFQGPEILGEEVLRGGSTSRVPHRKTSPEFWPKICFSKIAKIPGWTGPQILCFKISEPTSGQKSRQNSSPKSGQKNWARKI